MATAKGMVGMRPEKNLVFGRELRRLRLARGLSQPQLAALIPTDPTYISKVENGHRIPALVTVRAWDEALEAGGRLVALLTVQGATRPAQLPAGSARFFGRSRELAGLDDIFAGPAPASSPIVVAIDGVAGVGKTTLALQWAHCASKGFADGQLYIDLRGYSAGSPVRPRIALEEFLVALGISADTIPATVKQRAALYRSLLADRALLVVLDNAKDSVQIKPLLPGSPSCAVVITSRNQLSNLAMSVGAQRVTLGPLSDGESTALISETVGFERARAERDAVRALARQCAYLPLAMRIVAERVAAHPRQAIGELVDELTAAGKRLDGMSVGDSDAVRTALSWSYTSVDAEAARMWRLLGLHPGLTISVAVAAALVAVPPATARRLLAGLASVHLLETGPSGQYQFHDLLRDYAAELVAATETAEQRSDAVRRLTDFYLHTAYNSNVALAPEREMPLELAPVIDGVDPLTFSGFAPARDWCDAEASNFSPIARLAATYGQHVTAWQLSVVLWNYLVLRGPSHVWDACHRVAVKSARQVRDQSGESWVLNNLAYLMRLRRDYERSEELYAQALAIRRDIADDWGQAWSLVGLGMLNAERGHPTRTYEQVGQAHALFTRLGNRHGQGVALCVMADACRDLGQFDEGLRCLSDAFMVFDGLNGPRGRGYLLTKLGQLHHSRGALVAAQEVLKQALDARREAEHRAGEAETLTYLGEVLDNLGQGHQAELCWNQALEIWEKLNDLRTHDLRAMLRRH